MLLTLRKKKSSFYLKIKVKFVNRLAKAEGDRIVKKDLGKKTTTVVVSATTAKTKTEPVTQKVFYQNTYFNECISFHHIVQVIIRSSISKR